LAVLLLIAARCGAAAFDAAAGEETNCAMEDSITASTAGVAMITGGMKRNLLLKSSVEDPLVEGGGSDPFADLSEASDESLLQTDDDDDNNDSQDPPCVAGEGTEMAPQAAEPAPPSLAAANTTKLPVPVNSKKLLLPSARALLLVASLGIFLSALTGFALRGGAAAAKTAGADSTDEAAGILGKGGTSAQARAATLDTDDEKSPPGLTGEADEYGCTALHRAADLGAAGEVRALLAQGADVDCRDAWGETPLHFAGRGGSVEVVGLLLQHGAESSPANESGATPLVAAAKAGKEAACKVLLDHGAHVQGLADAALPPLLSSLLVERVFAEAGAGCREAVPAQCE